MRALDAKDHQEKSYVSSGNTSFPARNFSNFLSSTCLVRRILSGLGTALKFSLAAVSDQQMGVCIGQSEGPATGQYKIKAHKISPADSEVAVTDPATDATVVMDAAMGTMGREAHPEATGAPASVTTDVTENDRR